MLYVLRVSLRKNLKGGAKVEFIFFRGGNYKANQITFRLQTGVTVYVVTVYVVFITCVVMMHLLKITP